MRGFREPRDEAHMGGGWMVGGANLFEGSLYQTVSVTPLVRCTITADKRSCLYLPHKISIDHGKRVHLIKPNGFIPPMIADLIGVA